MQNVGRLSSTLKHLTKEEIEIREKAEEMFQREEKGAIQMPDYLTRDIEGMRVWGQVLSDADDFGLFDKLDAETLGTYCSTISRIATLRRKYLECISGDGDVSDILDISKELRLLEAQQLSYASKMGLTPESRLRLAHKAAAESADSGDDFYG